MEKDIEYRIKRFLDECEDGNWYWDDGVDAIENLIKGYRELHKDNKYLKEHIAMLICLEQENIDLNNELNKLKSKIKEIRDKAEVMDYYVLGDVIDDLNKLLEV